MAASRQHVGTSMLDERPYSNAPADRKQGKRRRALRLRVSAATPTEFRAERQRRLNLPQTMNTLAPSGSLATAKHLRGL